MATNYPYVSAAGAVVKAFQQFRKSFPPTLDADVLKKFTIAPANESYVISTFRFLGLIDEEGKRVEDATKFFYSDDAGFQEGLEARLKESYAELFTDHGEAAWDESKDSLSTWFRVTDKTSDLVGGRQANTFLTLSALAGHGEVKAPAAKKAAPAKKAASAAPAKKAAKKAAEPKVDVNLDGDGDDDGDDGDDGDNGRQQGVSLSVRLEVNLPANGTPEVYDAIFASVRKHLIDRD